tara:strand:+ start:491 stop:679 length:189 start_codon:yes stop_codon:yes gene_type:complete
MFKYLGQKIPKARHGLATIRTTPEAPYKPPEEHYNANLSQCIRDIKQGLRAIVGSHVLLQNI